MKSYSRGMEWGISQYEGVSRIGWKAGDRANIRDAAGFKRAREVFGAFSVTVRTVGSLEIRWADRNNWGADRWPESSVNEVEIAVRTMGQSRFVVGNKKRCGGLRADWRGRVQANRESRWWGSKSEGSRASGGGGAVHPDGVSSVVAMFSHRAEQRPEGDA